MPADSLSEFEMRVLSKLVQDVGFGVGSSQPRLSSRMKVGQTTADGCSLFSHLRTMKRWIATREVSELLHCHPETIYRRVKEEGLPAHRDGRRLKFYPPEIADWLELRDRKMSPDPTQSVRSRLTSLKSPD